MGVSVVLAEDDYLVREGVARLLSADPDIELAAMAEDLPSLLEVVARAQPDVVVTDIRMPPSRTDEGLRAAAALRASHPRTGVVVLSQYAEPEYSLALLEGGSRGRAYLLKQHVHDRARLVGAIREVAAGGSFIDSLVVEELARAQSRAAASPLGDLTSREREILLEIARGRSNGAIAKSLVLTKRAVEKHINSIFFKLDLTEDLDVSRRVKAALLFLSETRPEDGAPLPDASPQRARR